VSNLETVWKSFKKTIKVHKNKHNKFHRISKVKNLPSSSNKINKPISSKIKAQNLKISNSNKTRVNLNGKEEIRNLSINIKENLSINIKENLKVDLIKVVKKILIKAIKIKTGRKIRKTRVSHSKEETNEKSEMST